MKIVSSIFRKCQFSWIVALMFFLYGSALAQENIFENVLGVALEGEDIEKPSDWIYGYPLFYFTQITNQDFHSGEDPECKHSMGKFLQGAYVYDLEHRNIARYNEARAIHASRAMLKKRLEELGGNSDSSDLIEIPSDQELLDAKSGVIAKMQISMSQIRDLCPDVVDINLLEAVLRTREQTSSQIR